MGLLVDLAEFTCFYQFLHHGVIKMFGKWQIKTKQFYDHNMQELVNSAKSTNNPMSSFGLIKKKNGGVSY